MIVNWNQHLFLDTNTGNIIGITVNNNKNEIAIKRRNKSPMDCVINALKHFHIYTKQGNNFVSTYGKKVHVGLVN